MRRRLVVFIIIAIAALVFAACNKGASSAKVIREFEQAVNTKNVPVIKALCDTHCVFEFEKQRRYTGWTEIEPLIVWDTTVNTRISITIDSTVDNIVFTLNAQTNDWYTGFGVDTFTFYTTFQINNGKIAAVRSSGTPESRVKFSTQWQRLFGYMKLAHQEKLQQLLPNGEFSYTPENAHLWMEVFKDWQQMHEE